MSLCDNKRNNRPSHAPRFFQAPQAAPRNRPRRTRRLPTPGHRDIHRAPRRFVYLARLDKGCNVVVDRAGFMLAWSHRAGVVSRPDRAAEFTGAQSPGACARAHASAKSRPSKGERDHAPARTRGVGLALSP